MKVNLTKRTTYRSLLTPIECERLNGFNDNWTEAMLKRMRYFYMGNTLVDDLIRDMGMKIKEIDLLEKEETTQITLGI